MGNRGAEAYVCRCGVGSFDHAVFNLSNEQFEIVRPMNERIFGTPAMRSEMGEGFIAEPRETGEGWSKTEKNFLDYIKKSGLMVEECEVDAEYNPAYQWKIAYYRKIVNFEMQDVFFMRQEKDGRWSAKVGNRVEYFSAPHQHLTYERTLDDQEGQFSKFKTYIITNPYAKKRYEKKQYAKKFRRAQEEKVQ